MLSLSPKAKTVLDPCVGQGELTRPFERAGLQTTGYDIVRRSNVACAIFKVADFLEIAGTAESLPLFSDSERPFYDLVVANPPYNCHETDYIRKNKLKLIKRFGKSTVLNMYSLFLRAIIEYADHGAFIGLVTHDSFLTAIGHQELRRYILNQCTIYDLHLCPTALFRQQNADVRTCLMILRKGRFGQTHIHVSNRAATVSEFRSTLHARRFSKRSLEDITLQHERDNAEFIVGVPEEVTSLFSGRRLADIAPCITGISTGSDATYLRKEPEDGFRVPFYKNPASRRFFASADGYLCDNYEEVGKSVPNFMIRNRGLLSVGGLSCSSMGVRFGAAIRPPGTLCGVNPNVIINDERMWMLLSFLNSRLCLFIVRGVIIRSNMITAGYASRIPVPEFTPRTDAALMQLGHGGFQAAQAGRDTAGIRAEIDRVIEEELHLSSDVQQLLGAFEGDPTRLS